MNKINNTKPDTLLQKVLNPQGVFYASSKKPMVFFGVGLGFVLFACSGGKNRTDVEVFHDMIQQKNIKPQEGGLKAPWDPPDVKAKNSSKGGKTFMRKPPPHSRARGAHPYPYKAQLKAAEKNLKNPLKGNFSAYVVGLGKRQYEKACIYCHGASGLGDGKVALKMAVRPPSLMDKAFKYSDARLYHVIHEGQGLMGSYQWQVKGEKNRWALVNYIRVLQKNNLKRTKKLPLPLKKKTPSRGQNVLSRDKQRINTKVFKTNKQENK